MKFKKVYLLVIILTLLGFLFNLFLRDKMVYLFYGYDLSIFETDAFESFQAVNETYLVRSILFSLTFIITFLCFVISCVAAYWRIYTRYFFTYLVIAFNLLILFIYFISFTIPRRSF